MLPDWPRAHGDPLLVVDFKRSARDFFVEELLGFEPAGDGEHDLLFVEKTDTNTEWLARQLARFAGIPARDVGHCGLKDRRSVSRQWFSVRRPTAAGTDWDAFDLDDVSILDCQRHDRKLRPGSHAGNRFRILLYASTPPPVGLEERLARIAMAGVPNYFGEQRFGVDGGNIELAHRVLAGGRVKRAQRSIAISAARSFLFNEALARRVGDGSWNRLLPGDLANLDGSASVFHVDEVDDTLRARLDAHDIHPALSLWGEGAPVSSGAAADIENEVAAAHETLAAGLLAARVRSGSRATRLVPAEMGQRLAENRIELAFTLRPGQFATTLMREAFDLRQPPPDQRSSRST